MRAMSKAKKRLLELLFQDSIKLFGRLKKLRAQKKATRSIRKDIEKLLYRFLRLYPKPQPEETPPGWPPDPIHGRHVIYLRRD